MTILGIVALFLTMQTQVSQPPQTASLQGFVVQSGTTQRISKVSLELKRINGAASQPYIAITDSDGTYAFPNVAAGQYRLSASRNGFVATEYGQRGVNGVGALLTVAAGQRIVDLPLSMIRTAAISGRVFDGSGQPMVNAEVRALKSSFQEGRRVMTLVQSARTNDLGEYRLFWLAPGQYFVSAVPWDPRFGASSVVMNGGGSPNTINYARLMTLPGDRPGLIAFRAGPPSDTEAYVPVYFPGTMNETAASAIDLRSGMTFAGADFTIAPVIPRRVRGVVIDGITGQPARSAQLIESPNPSTMNTYLVDPVDPTTGVFEIRGMIPGSYTLIAMAGGLAGRASIEVDRSDLDGVTITLTEGITISGRVTIEGRAASAAELTGLRVSLHSVPLITGMTRPYASPAADGTITISKVLPGDYRVTVQPFQNAPSIGTMQQRPFVALPPPPRPGQTQQPVFIGPQASPLQPMPNVPPAPQTLQNAYVKSIHLGNLDVLNDGLRVDYPPEGLLEISIGTSPGALNGIVRDAKGLPVSNISAVIVPESARRHRTDLYKTVTTDVSGGFHFPVVPPGDYKVFAWEDAESGAWMDPKFVEQYEQLGIAFRVVEGTSANVEVIAIPYQN